MQKPIVKQIVTKRQITKTVNEDEIKAKQNIFFANLKKRINKNKSYPKVARRRGIQGEINVEFTISANGNIADIKILEGRKLFHKSVKKAIEKSFPVEIPQELFSFPLTFSLKVLYKLK